MKKLLTMLILLVLMAGTAYALLTHDQDFYVKNKRSLLSGASNDPLYQFIGEVDDLFSGTDGVNFLLYTPTTAPATAAKGQLYFDLASSNFKYYTTSWQTVAASTSSTLDEAYSAGQGITVDAGALTLTTTDAANNAALAIVHAETGAYNAVTIVGAGTHPLIDLDQNGSGGDIEGSDASWAVTKLGAATFLTVALENGEIISNATNDKILFDTGDEDLLLDMTTTANTITLSANSTGATTFAMGDFVTLTGLNTLTGAAGVDYTISTANTGTFNLVVGQTGTGDNELRLASAGTAANAIALAAATGGVTVTTGSGANGDFLVTTGDDMVINSGDDIDIDAADDITIDLAGGALTTTVTGGDYSIDITDKSYKLDSGEAHADAIWICATDAGGGINMDCGTGTLDIDVAGAININNSTAVDISVTSAAGAINLDSAQEAADAISVDASGTAGGVIIACGTGDITLDSGDDIFLAADTGTGDVISLIVTKGTSTSSIVVTSTVGGIDLDSALSTHITSAEATGDAIYLHASDAAGGVDITSGTGDIVLTSTDDIVLTNATAVGDMIQLLNTAGTSVTEDSAAIQLTATAGGIHIQSDASINGDTVVLRADGGATADILIHNDAGTGADCINLLADEGGITLTADGAGAGDILIDAEDDIQLTTTGKLTITNTEAMTVSGAATISGTTTVVGIVQVDQVVTDAAAYTVLAANSGKIHTIAALGQNTTIKLPAEADGLNYEFWYVGGAADAEDHNITSEDDAAYFIGGVCFSDIDDDSMTVVYSDGGSNSKFTIYNAAGGTIVKVTCDGSYWYITGTIISDTVCAFADQ